MEHNNLIDIASKARALAYVPYSKFAVGAAIVTKPGKWKSSSSRSSCRCQDKEFWRE